VRHSTLASGMGSPKAQDHDMGSLYGITR
jgi:hypothetical protein